MLTSAPSPGRPCALDGMRSRAEACARCPAPPPRRASHFALYSANKKQVTRGVRLLPTARAATLLTAASCTRASRAAGEGARCGGERAGSARLVDHVLQQVRRLGVAVRAELGDRGGHHIQPARQHRVRVGSMRMHHAAFNALRRFSQPGGHHEPGERACSVLCIASDQAVQQVRRHRAAAARARAQRARGLCAQWEAGRPECAAFSWADTRRGPPRAT